jgi:hypothetical protein
MAKKKQPTWYCEVQHFPSKSWSTGVKGKNKREAIRNFKKFAESQVKVRSHRIKCIREQ